MHFIYPAFLFALTALLIPVLVHLFSFRKYQKVLFSNVQFLKEVNEQQSSRKNLKERLILAARLLAVFFLVLAFARPYIPQGTTITPGKQQEISILVDNSYSMQTVNREGSLLDEARTRAKEIAAAYNINDRFQLLTQDFEGRHQRLLSREEFNEAVDAIKISPQSRTLQQILDRQQSLLNAQPAALKKIYVISDFQVNLLQQQKLHADTGINVSFVQLKANALPNMAIDSVWLLSEVHHPGETEKLVVRLHNYSTEEAVKIPLKLIINNEQKALGSFTVAGHAAQNDTLAFSGLKPGWQRGLLQLQDNPVTFDNRFFFSFQVLQQMPLLLIDEGAADPYLKAVFATDNFFNITRVPEGNVNYAGLNKYRLIALSNLKDVSAGLAQQLKAYVNKGGSLVVFPGPDADFNNYRSFLRSLKAAWPQKMVTAPTRVSVINLHTRLFRSTFEDIPQNPDLPTVKKYFSLNTTDAHNSESIMSMADGSPFFASSGLGRGRVYVSAVSLNEDFSNLPRHALFVPLMFRIALLSGHDLPLYYTLGTSEALEVPPVQLSEKQILKLQKDNWQIIPDLRQDEGTSYLYVADQLHEPGHYFLKKQDSTIVVLSFNSNKSESDLSYLSPAQLKTALPQSNVIGGQSAAVKGIINVANFGVQLWKLCLILALVFLATEILLVRFYKTDKGTTTKSAEL
jgi:hypothetical protein